MRLQSLRSGWNLHRHGERLRMPLPSTVDGQDLPDRYTRFWLGSFVFVWLLVTFETFGAFWGETCKCIDLFYIYIWCNVLIIKRYCMLDDMLLWWSRCVSVCVCCTFSECHASKLIPGILLACRVNSICCCLFILPCHLTSSITAGGPLISTVCVCLCITETLAGYQLQLEPGDLNKAKNNLPPGNC